MTFPSALTLVTVQGKIQAADGTPATGTVAFRVEETLRDPADHVLLAPTTFPAVLDETGAFEIDLPATDDPGITPTGWTYIVTLATDVLRDAWRIEVPAGTVGALQFDELAPASDAPAVVTYALASALNAETARAMAAEAASGGASEQDITDAITAHDAATDPHGDRAAASSALTAHTAAGDPHGDRAAAASALTTHTSAADPHGDRAAASTALTTHTGATDPHGDRAYTDTAVATKPNLTVSAATTSAVGDSAAAGSASTSARADHSHGRESFGAVTTQTTFGAASANGTATTVAHSDHTHGTPALTSSAPGNSAVGDAATVGVATAPAKADHKHGREAFGAVTALTAFNTASATGTATTVAHSDHVHGAPAIAAGDVPDLSATYTTRAREGAASGVATLDSSGLLTAAQANAGEWYPSDHGLLAWAFDTSITLAGSAILTGQVVLIAVKVPKAATISTLYIDITSAGSGLTGCAAGLYDSGGTLRGSTADQSTAWQSGGVKAMALTVPYSAAAGRYWVGLLTGTGSTTPPQVGRSSSQAGMPNLNLTGATIRYGVAPGSGLSALPSSFTPSGIGVQNIAWWAAVS